MTARLRSIGLLTTRAAAHNLPGQPGLKISIPVSTAPQAVQSNEAYLPQETIDDLRKLGAAADKR